MGYLWLLLSSGRFHVCFFLNSLSALLPNAWDRAASARYDLLLHVAFHLIEVRDELRQILVGDLQVAHGRHLPLQAQVAGPATMLRS